MRGRTIILVSHHVQLCAPGAQYIVSLDNGRVSYAGGYNDFQNSGVLTTLVQSGAADPADDKEETTIEKVEEIIEETEVVEKSAPAEAAEANSETSSTVAATSSELDAKPEKKKKVILIRALALVTCCLMKSDRILGKSLSPATSR